MVRREIINYLNQLSLNKLFKLEEEALKRNDICLFLIINDIILKKNGYDLKFDDRETFEEIENLDFEENLENEI